MSSPEDRKAAEIARINELSQLARTAWFSLLGYLVFVGITLLGVKDADFFVPARQTDLPLVNVAIPTASFFWTAPILGAALYTYLHLFLIKLWDAHAEARTTDADPTHHWLVGDFVLLRQRDPVARARPLAFLSDWITRLLVWAAAPIVFAYAWWRSMPAHDEWMTLLIGACLWVTLVVGFTSWWRAEYRLRRRHHGRWSTHWRRGAALVTALLMISASWLRTEGGFGALWTLDDVTIPAHTPVTRWFLSEDLVPLARIDLAGENLVSLPHEWRSPEAARSTFRETWCGRQALDMVVCGKPADGHGKVPAPLAADRARWCVAHDLEADACAVYFTDLEAIFATAWTEERDRSRASVPALDLHGRDLRFANARGALLIGADLSGARMAGANLREAQLEGANLDSARLEKALLSEARLDGANLQNAVLDGANLFKSRLDGAHMLNVSMKGASMSFATLDRAMLYGANLEGGDLSYASFEGADLATATLKEAELWSANLRSALLLQARLDDANLTEAELEGAQLLRARLSGAVLLGAELRGAILAGALLEGADLSAAELEGADLRGARLKGARFMEAPGGLSTFPAHFADFRNHQGLTQADLEGLIGDSETLLPEGTAPDTGQPFYVWSCWEDPPPDIDVIINLIDNPEASDTFVCGREPPYKTGTASSVDTPYRWGHPLHGARVLSTPP